MQLWQQIMTKLCKRGIEAAKRKYKVYPSAYANGYAVQVCKGMKPDAAGKTRTASGYTKGKRKTTRKKRGKKQPESKN